MKKCTHNIYNHWGIDMQQQKTSDNKFMKYFNAKVAPVAKNVEDYRPKLVKWAVIWASLIGLIPLPVIIFVLMSNIPITEKLFIIALCIVFICIIIASCIFSIKKIYALFAKEKIIPVLLGFWGNFTYIPPINLSLIHI